MGLLLGEVYGPFIGGESEMYVPPHVPGQAWALVSSGPRPHLRQGLRRGCTPNLEAAQVAYLERAGDTVPRALLKG
jgi:hypothetical protein